MTKEDKNRFLVSTPSSLIVWRNTNGRCNKRNLTKRNEKNQTGPRSNSARACPALIHIDGLR
jgi:hypothetical protein